MKSRSDLHLSAKSAYLVALVQCACVYQRNPVGVTLVDTGLTVEQTTIHEQIN